MESNHKQTYNCTSTKKTPIFFCHIIVGFPLFYFSKLFDNIKDLGGSFGFFRGHFVSRWTQVVTIYCGNFGPLLISKWPEYVECSVNKSLKKFFLSVLCSVQFICAKILELRRTLNRSTNKKLFIKHLGVKFESFKVPFFLCQ